MGVYKKHVGVGDPLAGLLPVKDFDLCAPFSPPKKRRFYTGTLARQIHLMRATILAIS